MKSFARNIFLVCAFTFPALSCISAEPTSSDDPAIKRKFVALGLIWQEAQGQELGSAARKELLNEFIEKSRSYLMVVPGNDRTLSQTWTFRAIAAIELNWEVGAKEAGLRMQALGLDKSESPQIVKTLALLERKGWLIDPKEVQAKTEAAAKQLKEASKDNPFVNSLGMEFVPVPGTTVLFSIWETRKGDYAAYAKANPGVTNNAWQNPEDVFGFKNEPFTPLSPSDDYPVVFVSWNDARRFCIWLTQNEQSAGKIPRTAYYRLPTDDEWSFAVGIGKRESGVSPAEKGSKKLQGIYPWGEQWPPLKGSGNYFDTTSHSRQKTDDLWRYIKNYKDGFYATAPVGLFTANQFGLYDMGGNMREMCEDKFLPEQEARVTRGASWCDGDPDFLLSSARNIALIDSGTFQDGFRCVLVIGIETIK